MCYTLYVYVLHASTCPLASPHPTNCLYTLLFHFYTPTSNFTLGSGRGGANGTEHTDASTAWAGVADGDLELGCRRRH